MQQCFLLSRCHHLKGLSSDEHAEEGRDLKCPLAQGSRILLANVLTSITKLSSITEAMHAERLIYMHRLTLPRYYQFYMRMAHGKQRHVLSMHNTRPLHKCRVEPSACYHRLYSSRAPHDRLKFQMNIYLLRGLWRKPW